MGICGGNNVRMRPCQGTAPFTLIFHRLDQELQSIKQVMLWLRYKTRKTLEYTPPPYKP